MCYHTFAAVMVDRVIYTYIGVLVKPVCYVCIIYFSTEIDDRRNERPTKSVTNRLK